MKKVSGLLLALSLFLVWAFPVSADSDDLVFSGRTMGTTYRVKVLPGPRPVPEGLHDRIRIRLGEINRSMSVFMTESEISRFNETRPGGDPFPVSADFLRVMQIAREVHRITGGAWDGTVKPLVNAWGFGTSGSRTAPPEPKEIREALKKVGFQHVGISDKGHLIKDKTNVTLDLASIAKGYGVDALATLLRESGIRRFLVEIGGEVYASGLKRDGSPWHIGINEPKAGAPLDRIHRIVKLTDMALATSGDYRNFFMKGGIRFSHVIDPRTGYPVSNGVVSASVLAKSCTLADALATALMVMGPEKGVAMVNRLESVECLIIVQNKDASLHEFASDGFHQAASD